MPTSPAVIAAARLWAALIDAGICLAWLGTAMAVWAPPQDQPWTLLRLTDPPGLATGFKFEAAARDPERCRRVLRDGGVGFTEAPPRRAGACVIGNALRLRDGVPALSPASPVMTCPEALAYAFWARHAVQPAARAHLGSPVVRIDHYGVYACRRVRGGGSMSQHAFANALDVAGFRTGTGAYVSVAADYREDGPRGRFLRESRAGACRWFRAVLGPDYNAAHADHFHLDRGPWSRCG